MVRSFAQDIVYEFSHGVNIGLSAFSTLLYSKFLWSSGAQLFPAFSLSPSLFCFMGGLSSWL